MIARRRLFTPRARWSAVVVGALALACSGRAPSKDARARAPARASLATAGQAWYVNVARPAGGTISSADGLIRCGVAGAACGDAQGWTQYPASQASVTLTAVADVARGWTFVQWAGACTGTSPTCTLAGGAQSWVGAVFRSPTHASGPSRFLSTYGVQVYASGGGTVYSDDGWLVCRAGSCFGYFAWNTVAVLQGVPDPGYQLGTWAGDCTYSEPCRLSTSPYGADKYVVPVFSALPDVAHGNYTAQALHGPAYFDFIGGRPGARPCTNCHGATLDGQGLALSCNACHAQRGWTSWATNCSFCHGARNARTMAGYALSAQPTWAAPPDAIAERLDPAHAPAVSRTGAHQAHLTGVTAGGLSFARPFSCATCHPVPADVKHIAGSGHRARVALSGAGQASLPASLGSYDPVSGTCTTLCHGASPSPAWWSTQFACGSCHGLPPAVSTGHPEVSASLPGCRGCHPDTVLPDGSIDLAGGKHVDGLTEAAGGHGDYASPAVHGPAFFAALRGDGDCRGCHGAAYGGGLGPSCDDCHARAGWTVSWQTNCSFCHGTRTAETMTVPYDVALKPRLSAPPDALSQRLTGTAAPARSGAHAAHLAGQGSDGATYAPALLCSTCHTVPSDLAHAGGPGTAPVVLVGNGSFPLSLGSYAPGAGTCATYCHGRYAGTYTWQSYDWSSDSLMERAFQFQGSGASPRWSDGPMTCASCHGNPPQGGSSNWWHNRFHGNGATDNECQLCHPDATGVNGAGLAITSPALHIDGMVEVTPRWTSRCFGCH